MVALELHQPPIQSEETAFLENGGIEDPSKLTDFALLKRRKIYVEGDTIQALRGEVTRLYWNGKFQSLRHMTPLIVQRILKELEISDIKTQQEVLGFGDDINSYNFLRRIGVITSSVKSRDEVTANIQFLLAKHSSLEDILKLAGTPQTRMKPERKLLLQIFSDFDIDSTYLL